MSDQFNLSPREKDVLCLMIQGMTNQQISNLYLDSLFDRAA